MRARAWTGICREVQEIAVEESGLSTYRIEIVPALWLASQRRNHRMFQLVSDVDIALKLLSEWGIEPVLELSATYKKRKYRVQYGESDHAFICRLLEDSGISFYFTGDSGETRLVLSDAPEAGELRDPHIAFRDKPGDADLEHVTAVRTGRRVRPGRYTLRDHDYRQPPAYPLLASAAAEAGIEQQLERFHYTPGAFLFESDRGPATPAADDRGRYRTDEAEAAAMAQRRLEAQRGEAFSCTFESNAIDLSPGVVFAMRQHPRRDLAEDRRLLVVRTTLHAEVGKTWKLEGEARSARVRHRPPLSTPRPRTNGVESATVVGPAGEEIHTDEFGRVRVHFHWDRESRMNENSSCWIHVSQSWGGTGYGGVNLPRIGQEVLVDFLGGDPDRPVIIGRVYTNLQKVPYPLPDNRTQSGWRSNSTTATGGYNEMMFEDSAGQELLRMQAEKDMHKLVKNDEQSTVGRDRTRQVQRNEAVTVGKDRTKQVARPSASASARTRASPSASTAPRRSATTTPPPWGIQHLVMIAPPGEGGPSTSSSITMTDKKIVLDTGAGATITMDHDRISIVADDLVEIWGKKRGVNLHAPAAGGKANVFTGDAFTVDCKNVSLRASDRLAIVGNVVDISAESEVKIEGAVVDVKGTPIKLNS